MTVAAEELPSHGIHAIGQRRKRSDGSELFGPKDRQRISGPGGVDEKKREAVLTDGLLEPKGDGRRRDGERCSIFWITGPFTVVGGTRKGEHHQRTQSKEERQKRSTWTKRDSQNLHEINRPTIAPPRLELLCWRDAQG